MGALTKEVSTSLEKQNTNHNTSGKGDEEENMGGHFPNLYSLINQKLLQHKNNISFLTSCELLESFHGRVNKCRSDLQSKPPTNSTCLQNIYLLLGVL